MTAAQVKDVLAGTRLVDVRAAIIAALDYAYTKGGARFRAEAGDYLCNSIIKPTAPATFVIEGDGHAMTSTAGGVTNFIGAHAGDAVLSLRGCVGCELAAVNLFGQEHATLHPKASLFLGRNSAASAGWHRFNLLGVHGRYSVAGAVNIASEGNLEQPLHELVGQWHGGHRPLPVRWRWDWHDMGKRDAYRVQPAGAEVQQPEDRATRDGSGRIVHVYRRQRRPGSIVVDAGYLIQKNGHNVTIRNGSIDGKDTLGPITFIGTGGEQPGGVGTPLSGFNLLASVGAPVNLHGLVIDGVNFQMNAGKFIRQDAYVKMNGARINGRGMVAPLTDLMTFQSSTIGNFGTGAGENTFDCGINVGFGPLQKTVQALTLSGTWSTAYAIANAYEIPGYYTDRDGFVHLVGVVGAGGAATIGTLAAGNRPLANKTYTVTTNTGIGSITIATTGVITLNSGGMDPVHLDGVIFKAA